MKRSAALLMWSLATVILLYNASGALKELGVLPQYVISQHERPGGLMEVVVDTSVISATNLQRILVNLAFALLFAAMGYMSASRRGSWWGWTSFLYFLPQAAQGIWTGNIFKNEWIDEIILLSWIGMAEVILRKTESIVLKSPMHIAWKR